MPQEKNIFETKGIKTTCKTEKFRKRRLKQIKEERKGQKENRIRIALRDKVVTSFQHAASRRPGYLPSPCLEAA